MESVSGQDDDGSFQSFYEELRNNGYSSLTLPQFFWAVERIKGRARTPPISRGFWSKSLPRLLDSFLQEVDCYFTEEAERLRGAGDTLGAVAEKLKCLAAQNDLPYSPVQIQAAIDQAEARVRRSASLRNELRVGKGPEPRRGTKDGHD